MFRVIVLLLAGSVTASAQSPIGDVCAKGLKALEAIDNAPKSDEARAAFNAARRECFIVNEDQLKGNEFAAFLLVDTFKTGREQGPMPSSCTNAIEDAFRHNATLGLPPESCFVRQNWDEFKIAWHHNWR